MRDGLRGHPSQSVSVQSFLNAFPQTWTKLHYALGVKDRDEQKGHVPGFMSLHHNREVITSMEVVKCVRGVLRAMRIQE